MFNAFIASMFIYSITVFFSQAGMANQVLDRISYDVREILRLVTDSRNNEDVCLTKLESSIVHFNSISHLLDTSTCSSVEQSLFALRDELRAAKDVTVDHSRHAFVLNDH
jgi:hypothetical protein